MTHTRVRNKGSQKGKGISSCAPANYSAVELFAQMEERAKQSRKEFMLRKSMREKVDLNLLSDKWTKTIQRAYPEHPGAVKKKGMLALQSHLSTLANAGADWSSYITWCIEDWKRIVANYFSWMKAKPFYPEVWFLVRFSDQFQTLWAARRWREELAKKTPDDQFVAVQVATGTDEKIARKKLAMRKEAVEKQEREVQERMARMRDCQRKPYPKPKGLTNGEGSFGKWEEDD